MRAVNAIGILLGAFGIIFLALTHISSSVTNSLLAALPSDPFANSSLLSASNSLDLIGFIAVILSGACFWIGRRSPSDYS